MRTKSRSHVFLAGALLALQGLAVESADIDPSSWDKNLPRAVAALTAAGDADSLAAAAGLTPFDDKERRAQQLALLKRAVALAPGRADLLWLETCVCANVTGCDATVYAEDLHKVDPGNGVAWLPLIDRATKLNDAEALRGYLAALSKSERFDLYWNPRVAHLANALIRVNVYHAGEALVAMFGVEAATAIPAFKNAANACKEDALQDSERLATCRGIAKVLRAGDTYVAELMGISIAMRAWPEGSAEYNDAAAARRVAHFRMREQGDPDMTYLENDSNALEYLSLLGTHRTEQELRIALVSRAGQSLSPPPDWRDEF